MGSLVVKDNFEHILRIMSTNVNGAEKATYAFTAIPGVGRRYSDLVLKKAGIDRSKRAGELTKEEVDQAVAIIEDPLNFKFPTWFLNHQKEFVTGKDMQVTGVKMAGILRDDLERLKKMRLHRGLRHYWGLRVRGQHTKTTGRHGKTVGIAKKKG